MLANANQGNHDLYRQIQKRSPEVHDFLEQCEVGTIFALPWMITWFGHVLPDYEDVVRLYDFFLSKVSEHLGNACGQVKISCISG